MAFTNEQIQEVIDKTDIVDLVSQYVTLEKSGAQFRGLCPFHNEKTPSFMVSPSKKIAKCMGCGAGGNPITFLQKIKNISFNEAIHELADKVGIKLDDGYSYKKVDNNARLYEIMEISKKFYVHNLLNTKSGLEALEYLHKRGIDDETIKKFEIGLSLNTSDSLYKVLKESNYNELDMINLGLIKSDDNRFYDLFRNRIMFPIKNENGKVIAFSARIFNTADKEQPKYVNSPESPVFKKHLTLYHLSDAIPTIRRIHRVILHEGQMDVIASVKSGFDEAICSLGTALTKDQVAIIKKYATEAVVAYDGDNAGIKAMLKAIKLFEDARMKLKLVILPNDEDPDSYTLKYGAKAFSDYINDNQLDSLDFIFEYAIRGKDFTNNADIEEAKQLLFENLSSVSSQSSVERYIGKLADLINVSKASLLMDFNRYYTPAKYEKNDGFFPLDEKNSNIEQSRKYLSSAAWAELRILNYAKFSRYKADEIEKFFPNHDIRPYLEPIHQELWDVLTCDYYMEYENFVEQVFMERLSERLLSVYLQNVKSLYDNNDSLVPYNDDDLKECVDMITMHLIVKQIDETEQSIRFSTEKDKAQLIGSKMRLLKQLNEYRKKKRK